MKKWLCLVLALVLVLSCGCGNGANKGGSSNIATQAELSPEVIGDYGSLKLPLDENNTKISMLVVSSAIGLNDSVVVKELERRTGIDLDIVTVPTESMQQKMRLLIASKDMMHDIMGYGFYLHELNELGAQGAFEPINKHFDELPNFSEIFIKNPEKYDTVNTLNVFYGSDNNMYSFPTFDTSRYVNHGMLYRKDIFDKHGIKMWNNKEELLEVLRQLKKLYPDSYPLSSKTKTQILQSFGYEYFSQPFSMSFDHEAHEWEFASYEKEFKELLDYMRTLYKEGLIHPEFLTMTETAWTAEMVQPYKTFVTWDWIGRLDTFTQTGRAYKEDYDLRYGNPPDGKVPTLQQVKPGNSVKKGKNSLLALKLLDYLISPSGAELMTVGVEGKTFNFDENGKVKYIGFEDKVPTINELEAAYGMFVAGLYHRMDRRSCYFNYTEREQEAQDMMLAKEDGFYPLNPEVTFTDDLISEITELQVDLTKRSEEFAVKYILGDLTDKDYDEFIKTLEKNGVEKLVEEHNKAQVEYDKRSK